MDDNAHARYTQEEILRTFGTYWILADQKSQHAQLSFNVSPHFVDSLGPNSRGLERWDSFTAVTFASILSAQHNFGLRLLFRWHGVDKTG